MNARILVGRTVALLASVSLLQTACNDIPPASPEVAAVVVPAGPVLMDYVKTETASGSLNWIGSVSGDVNGDLETRVVGATQSGHMLHIQTEWSVAAGAESFEAALEGTLDTSTGRLLLNGEVTSGYLAGARAHNQGRLTGTDAGTGGTVFEGFLRIVPGSAN